MSETPTLDAARRCLQDLGVLEQLGNYGLDADLYRAGMPAAVQPIGSWHAFGAGRDIDFVVYCNVFTLEYSVDLLVEQGYTRSSTPEHPEGYPENDVFVALRKGMLNVLLTANERFYERSGMAYELVCALNLRNKRDRVIVHQIVVDGGLHG
jgi:hypothetical protein